MSIVCFFKTWYFVPCTLNLVTFSIFFHVLHCFHTDFHPGFTQLQSLSRQTDGNNRMTHINTIVTGAVGFPDARSHISQ